MPPVRPATGQSPCAPIRRHTEGSTTDGADIGRPAFAGHPNAPRAADGDPSAARILDLQNLDCQALDHQSLELLSAALTRELGTRNVEHWFRNQTTFALQGEALVVGVGSAFLSQWMQRQFRAGVMTAAAVALGAAGVRFEVDPRLASAAGENELGRIRPARPPGSSAPSGLPPQGSPPPHSPRPNASRSTRSERRGPVSVASVLPAAGTARAPSGPLPSAPHSSGVHISADAAVPPASSTRAVRSTPPAASSPTGGLTVPGSFRRTPPPEPITASEGGLRQEGVGTQTAATNESDSPEIGLSPASRSDADGTPRTPPAKSSPAVAAASSLPAKDAPSLRTARRLADLGDVIEGPCNELALTAARQVAEAPGTRINPLFLYGGVGIGKTLILEGIARRIRRTFPAAQVMLLTAESFANFFTEALRDKTLPSFRQRFRTVDVLLVDDVDFLDGKKVTQEEFLHTFKQLECLGRQVVVTADRHPRLFQKSSEDLITRLVSGLVCRIENPDVETRRRIVHQKAAHLGAEFAPDALTYVAQRFAGNVRELEGALHSLATWHAVTKRRVTVSAARSVLADLERDCVKVVRVGDVEETVCRFFGVSSEELRSPSRTRTLSQPRMLAMFLARKLTQAAYSEIGQHFGGRNHATVISAERKVQEWLAAGTPLRLASREWSPTDLIDALEQQLRAS